MKIFMRLLILLFILVSQNIQAAEQNKAQNSIEQLKILLQQAEKDLPGPKQNAVYLGTSQVTFSSEYDFLIFNIRRIRDLLTRLEENQSKNKIALGLEWMPVTNNRLPANLVNVGLPNQETINICRAPFVGAQVQEQALYPGQYTKAGCRISYAGYAFIVDQFDVLAGKDTRLEWIPMREVKKHMSSSSYPYRYQSQLINFNINIKGAVPVAGGYQGGNPVLICRVKQNNIPTIGKLVFFDGKDGLTEQACDIGVSNKEVAMQDDYELLFCKP
jgi:Protein of unknown function (DUF3421)